MQAGWMRRVALALLATLLAGCGFTTPREPAPPALREFLEALRSGDYSDAYGMTQLDEISEAFGDGSAVTESHFQAAWAADPLTSYEIVEVVRLRRRAVTDFGEGTPYFETRVRLSTAAGSRLETIAIDGEVAGTVQIDPLAVRIISRSKKGSVLVDGVPVVGAPAPERFVLLLLPGRHQVEIANSTFDVSLDPFEVTGDAVISQDLEMTIEVG